MVKKLLILTILLFLSIGGSIFFVRGQDTTNSLISFSTETISFSGREGSDFSSRNLIIVGLVDDVDINIFSSELYSNDSGKSFLLASNVTNPFSVSKDEPEVVNFVVPSDIEKGNYVGSIIVVAEADNNVNSTNISILANISAPTPLDNSLAQWGLVGIIFILIFIALIIPYESKYYSRKLLSKKSLVVGIGVIVACLWLFSFVVYGFTQWGLVGIIFILIFIALIIPYESKYYRDYFGFRFLSKKSLVVGIGVIVACLWLFSLVEYGFGEASNVITTILIAPFLAYAIGIVKDLRSERLEKEKVSRGIRDKGIEKDLELIRNLIGEMGTHCASFKPNFYEKKAKMETVDLLEEKSYILYNKTGLLAKKVWEESCRQGVVADIHTLHLEKYYDFIPIYNQFYYKAMNIEKEKGTNGLSVYTENDKKFLKNFKILRKEYGELQEVLFVYLSYILELYSKTTLTPMKLEYPRITRTLLKKLIGYGILEPWKFINQLNTFKAENLVKEMEYDWKNDDISTKQATKNLENYLANMKLKEEFKTVDFYKKYSLKNHEERFRADLEIWLRKNMGNIQSITNQTVKAWITTELKDKLSYLKKYEANLRGKFEKWTTDTIEKIKLKVKDKTPDALQTWLENDFSVKNDFGVKLDDSSIYEEEFETDFEELVKEKVLFDEQFSEEKINNWVINNFKNKIREWRFTADDLNKIVNAIFSENEIPHFFRHFQDDFQHKYIELKKCIRKLEKPDPLPPDSDIKEYKISLGNTSKKNEKTKKETPDLFSINLETKTDLNPKKKSLKNDK